MLRLEVMPFLFDDLDTLLVVMGLDDVSSGSILDILLYILIVLLCRFNLN